MTWHTDRNVDTAEIDEALSEEQLGGEGYQNREYHSGATVPATETLEMPSGATGGERGSIARSVREQMGWQENYFPPLKRASGYRTFRRLCDELIDEVVELKQFVVDSVVTEDGVGAIAEIENILTQLYDCPWGEGESLKNVVVGIRFQVSNARWTQAHVAFMEEIASLLRPRYVIDESVVEMCYDMVDSHGLDIFRGTVSEPEVVRRFKLVEDTTNSVLDALDDE